MPDQDHEHAILILLLYKTSKNLTQQWDTVTGEETPIRLQYKLVLPWVEIIYSLQTAGQNIEYLRK